MELLHANHRALGHRFVPEPCIFPPIHTAYYGLRLLLLNQL